MGRMDRTSPPVRDSRNRRFRIAVVLVSVVAAVAGSVALAMRDSSEKTTRAGVALTRSVPGHPGAVVAGPDALWVAVRRRPHCDASTFQPGHGRRPWTWVGRFLT